MVDGTSHRGKRHGLSRHTRRRVGHTMGYGPRARWRHRRSAGAVSFSRCLHAQTSHSTTTRSMKAGAYILLIVLFTRMALAATPPNILFLVADDLRADALGCAGNKIVQTPNIDGLAKRGTMFRNAFVTTSICCVSRASLFSGQYARRHGIADFKTSFTDAQW